VREIASPAFQLSVAAGESMTGTGVFDADTVTIATFAAPAPSVTRSCTS